MLRLSVTVPQSPFVYLLTRDIGQELLPSFTGEIRNPEMLTGRAWCPIRVVSLSHDQALSEDYIEAISANEAVMNMEPTKDHTSGSLISIASPGQYHGTNKTRKARHIRPLRAFGYCC